SLFFTANCTFIRPRTCNSKASFCYGGSYRLFDSLAKRGCYRVLFVDLGDEQALRAALAEKPKLVLVELMPPASVSACS
ncbi:PLP-dependent transferase, partial [Escherichia coli]|nr:PLP-dependent transferase [Escherichia coli]